jgi:hypothetical protein
MFVYIRKFFLMEILTGYSSAQHNSTLKRLTTILLVLMCAVC